MMQLPLVAGVGGLDRLRGSTQENESRQPRAGGSAHSGPAAGTVNGWRGVLRATHIILIENIGLSRQASRISG
jgi:hypothetical protein